DAVAKERLAAFCDVFVDEGYFTADQGRRILGRAKSAGFGAKIHADELADTGGASVAAEVGAVSADHLLHASPEGIEGLARTGVIAVLLPATSLASRLPYADGRREGAVRSGDGGPSSAGGEFIRFGCLPCRGRGDDCKDVARRDPVVEGGCVFCLPEGERAQGIPQDRGEPRCHRAPPDGGRPGALSAHLLVGLVRSDPTLRRSESRPRGLLSKGQRVPP